MQEFGLFFTKKCIFSQKVAKIAHLLRLLAIVGAVVAPTIGWGRKSVLMTSKPYANPDKTPMFVR